MRVLLLGGGAREHAIGEALRRDGAHLVVGATNVNPGLVAIASSYAKVDPTQVDGVVALARQHAVDYAVVGPEAPLAAGVGDALRAAGVPVVGPSRDGARLESSKRWCRDLLEKYRLGVSPRVVAVTHLDQVDARVAEFHEPFVVKPVALSGGKGVAVMGADFATPAEGASYAKQLLASAAGRDGILLEEKVEGEEFSLMAFVTDSGVYPMPAVQDFKRAQAGDAGPNTGGMGSYTQRDHLLPFLSSAMLAKATETLRRTVEALRAEGIPYRGILYGGFMLTSRGPVLLEYNARFGDPESINVLDLYEPGNLVELLYGVATGRVSEPLLSFRQRATVVRYLVAPGYPGSPAPGGTIELDLPEIERLGVQVRYGAVEGAGAGRVSVTTGRAVALLGEASAVHEAAARVDAALAFVRGTYEVRRDIGTKADLARRVEHVRRLLLPGAKPSPLPLSVAAPGAPPSSAASADQVPG